ncbi:MAG TPA: hypothetical protein VKD08_00660 [Ignavibacteriaceae bacterium]|nr:hypothetical protein [Ignavibacteriaceae bacterium]
MKYFIYFYLLITLFVIPVQPVTAQNKKVLVEVTTNQSTPDKIKTRFTGFVKDELRKLNDVFLVENNESYKIKIMMFENLTKERESLGFVFSTVFLAPSDCKGYKTYTYLTSILSTAKESQLDSTAQNIVSSFKENVLEAP